jgi:xanthine dehydrogenase accessory factor
MMRERRQIVELWERGEAEALVTLVRVEGSSYRRTGARLLVAANGDYAGSISGGCLEAEVVRKAKWLVREGATIQRYSTLFDDTAEIPYGLGCGGTVNLLLEPAGTPEFERLMEGMRSSLRGETLFVETGLPTAGKALYRIIQSVKTAFPPRVSSDCPSDSGNTFCETLEPPQRLFVFGAGDDARPVVRMASLLGWSVIVVDARPQWARAERFPEAERVLVSPVTDDLRIDSRDAVAVMTHSYEQDRAWLAAVLPHSPRYLGLLGARHRSALLVSEAAVLLGWTLERVCAGIFAPVGLDLGGDGAEAIALSIVAEIQACREGKLGASRRMAPETVMALIAKEGASRYVQTQCAL